MDLDFLKSKIRSVPDWPKKGIVFWDITPVLADKELFQFLIDELAKFCRGKEIDRIVGIDARGFILASALAYKLKKGLTIIRKKGKLPPETIGNSYALEYGVDALEMRKDAIRQGEKVLIVDDLLATGSTVKTTVDIIEKLGGSITAILFFIELEGLAGREKLKNYKIESLIKF